MTKRLIVTCDHEGCNAEAVIPDGGGTWEAGKGWGSFSTFQPQDFCPIHWPQYCKDNDIDPETGQYN